MEVGCQYFWSKWSTSFQAMITSVQAMINRLKDEIGPHSHVTPDHSILVLLAWPLLSLRRPVMLLTLYVKVALDVARTWNNTQPYLLDKVKQLVGCWRFTSRQHLRSYQDGYWLVTVCTHSDFIVLPYWGCWHHDLIFLLVTLSWHWANQ